MRCGVQPAKSGTWRQIGETREAAQVPRFLRHRASAARRAMADRSSAESGANRRLPPILPPLAPCLRKYSSAAAGSRRHVFRLGIGSYLIVVTVESGSSFDALRGIASALVFMLDSTIGGIAYSRQGGTTWTAWN